MPMWYTKLIYLILLVVGLLFAILYDGLFSILLFCILLLLPLTQLWLLHHVRRRLSVSLQVKQSEIQREAPQQLYCNVQNKSHFPLNYCHMTLELKNETTKQSEYLELQLPIQSKFQAAVSFQFTSSHCGNLQIRVKRCRIMDYLHLFSCNVRKKEETTCVVLPSMQADEFSFQNIQQTEQESITYDPNRPGDDNTELFGVREFQDGDNPKRIHWKRSSRSETWFVKEYSRPLERQSCILLDRLSSGNITPEQIDAQMECAYALGCILLRQQVSFVIAWNTASTLVQTPVADMAQLQTCMAKVLEDEPPEAGNVALLQLQQNPPLIPYANLIHIGHTLLDPTMTTETGAGKTTHLLTTPDTTQQAQTMFLSLETLPSVLSTICNS